MSSKKDHGEKKYDGSAQGKSNAEKKRSSKKLYQQKGYESSPLLSFSSVSASHQYPINQLLSNDYEPTGQHVLNKNVKKNKMFSPDIVSPQYMSVCMNYESEAHASSKQEDSHTEMLHSDIKYKIDKEPKQHILPQPSNQNLHFKYRFTKNKGNDRFQNPRENKQSNRNICSPSKMTVSNHQQNSSFTFTAGNRHFEQNTEKCDKSYAKNNYIQGKITKGHSKSGKRGKNYKDMKMKSPGVNSVTPLLSFHSVKTDPEESFDAIQYSDDDDSCVASQHSVDTANLIDLSDCESDSEISEESNLTSEVSVTSGALDSETGISCSKPSDSKKDTFVSVYWDVENCKLPSKKSVVDFSNYVRNTFCEGYTEVAFTAVCHASHLNALTVRDFYDADISLIHRSSKNKNSVDKTIISYLQKFQNQYRNTDSAVVLISSDSVYSQMLLDMQCQHNIFVNLICKNNAQDSLIIAANNYVFFDEILDHLPDHDVELNKQHAVILKNLPKMQVKVIKDFLVEKLKKFDYKLKFIDTSVAKIIFKDYSDCDKAMKSLKGLYLGENAINIIYEAIDQTVISKKEKKKPKISFDVNEREIDLLKNNATNSEEFASSKVATLCVVVNMCLRDVKYWKIKFENMWNMSDFSVEWDDNTFGGCFLVSFKSLKKAQKAKKILQKNQNKDPDSPKFLKLIKHGENLDNLKVINIYEIEAINKRKIDEHIQIIETKKLKLLKKHEDILNEKKHQAVSSGIRITDVVNEKLKECEDQIETFKKFANRTVNAIKELSPSSRDLDNELKEFLCDFGRECNCITASLPIYAKKEIIIKKVRENQVIVIRAETGSGKSTQLTQYIWRERSNFKTGKIICTQPRKIAAISLAKHVSSQVGCSLGDVVGYQIGMSNKMSVNTEILYVTDFTMLKLLVSDDLDNISCIIIDEAHERTIYTDILLGMIKQYLPMHPQLRVIVTSATIDTSLFRDFFSLTDDAVLQISGRTFPVQDEWLQVDVSPNWDYFSKSVNKAFEILTEEPGDVLSFLTTPLETEKALESFSNKLRGTKHANNVKVFCLHGKMNSEEQQKVFQTTPQGVRKVVFSTNCAETSITIPGIRYVIDCGLAKESKYDAVRNMNILSVGFISKSSAEQRRGRAGRTQAGKCYHLYSKKNYDCMEANTVPEILRINLGQALLKLLKIGVKDPLQFDFIQSPPRERLTSAMDQLLFLKAVDENVNLTDLGKNMAALPLEPRLCHLIFQGFDNDIGYDTVVTAALITMSQTVFFRNSENKDEADKKKKRFCESENDFITYLEVYKEWVDVPKPLKSQWCVINCINARSMRTVHDLVNEIITILQNELSIGVKSKFNCEATVYDTLTKVIFYSFSQNLSVFSGHSRFGYRNLTVTDQLHIHPSSSVSAFDQSFPPFVVYDTILKTTRTFIVNVCPITSNLISDAIKLYDLKIDFKRLEDLVCSELSIYPVGEKMIINNFIGKKGIKCKEILGKLKERIQSDLVDIVADVSKGSIKIYAYSQFDEIKALIDPIISNARKALLNEAKDVYLCEESNEFTAVLAAGGKINDVILPGEFRDVKVVLKGQENFESVCEKLSLCGTITDTRAWKRYFKVTFDTPASAKKALETYKNETEFSLQSINKFAYVNERDYLYKVFMKFFRRPCTGIAFITVEPRISAFSLPSCIKYKDTLARATISKKTQDLRITDLPPNTEKKELESVVSEALPAGVKITKCVVLRKKTYESAKEELDSIKKNILELFVPFTFKENITIHLKKPAAHDFYWNATVYFKNSLDGEVAINALKSRKDISNFIGGFIFKPQLQTFLCCKRQIFSVVKEEIEQALEFFKKNQSNGSFLTINAFPKDNNTVEVKIMSNNVCDITDARRCISTILTGDELKFPKNSHKVQLFSNSGKEMFKKLSEGEDFQDCYILQNEYNRTISLFGKESTCNKIKLHINEFLNNAEDDELKEFSLKTSSGKTGVLKELLKIYGYDLQKLKEDCGVSDVEINKYKQQIIIQGSPSSIEKCEALIQIIKEKLDANSTEVKGEICSVCFDEVSENKHRLEYCGHAYCTECLLHLFQSSENIPLNCESCRDPIVLIDIFWAIRGRKQLEKTLFRKFLHSFVESRDDISFCPSPDCPMIFRVTKDEMNIFRCPSCGNSICTKCEDFYHSGMTCSLHKVLKHNVDKSLEIWKKEDSDNRKACPSCSAPIEKNGGCNHMTCWKCKCHMCWLCLKVYPTSHEVYYHQPMCPMKR